MSAPKDSNLVKFAELTVRKRLSYFSAEQCDPKRVEPFLAERKEQWRAMPEAQLAEQILLDLGPHEFHVA